MFFFWISVSILLLAMRATCWWLEYSEGGGGGEREVEGLLKAIIMNYRIEQKETFEHNFLQDVMGDGQKHNDQVFAHNLCETCSG